MAVKKNTFLSLTSTTGYERKMTVRVGDQDMIIDRVTSTALLVHRPGWFERRWRHLANRIKYHWRRLIWGLK